MSMTIQSSVKDKILATSSETSKYEYEIRYHPGKANVVTDALSRKERVKPRRVRAMAMTIQYGCRVNDSDSPKVMGFKYGHIKDHKKTSKTGKQGHGNQKSTKRSQRIKAKARKVKPAVKSTKAGSQSQKKSNLQSTPSDGKVRLVISKLSLSSLKLIATSAMVKAHIVMGFCANLLTKEAQAVTIKE
ncbi:hypothetical protein Tco_1338528 [Tanacetum coccineum]